ncbi:hypothetical protein GLOTRDRAFT_35098 [Gloeophyllum trabeum ATCC 11539]|uniref:DUF7704 domain-containing protein n=1 Tax=Gloeophyllum trabeum (strain ATCC 11539 / FP-39264 / Madison 617) TaxID=670483 RepID=S7QJF0_GLOTA|nr:uncharacterized protein GLOTRDRAFT_35098 [Gloeophyllum trabeum ATCC 11539]EPQ59458.1 hypothetical protein GLOTRDRAFT_35098 [Gloeophyllum trabeum ATCC 11539]
MSPPQSAIPGFYYAVFGFYEPFLTLLGLMGTIVDPKRTHDAQAPWPNGMPPSSPLPQATLVTLFQLAHVCALIGLINVFVLSAARKHLYSQPALQEKIVGALLTPLLCGDVLHLYVTLWALGPERWNVQEWGAVLWSTLLTGLTLIVPRIAWHLGIGRYVDKRDGHFKGHIEKRF